MLKPILMSFVLLFSNLTPLASGVNDQFLLNDNVLINGELNVSKQMWHSDALSLDQDFKLGFYVKISDNTPQGDGITFSLVGANTPSIPKGGHGGKLGILDVPNVLALEFDVHYNNDGNSLESDARIGVSSRDHKGHVALKQTNDRNGTHYNVMHDKTQRLGNNKKRRIDIAWDAQTQTLNYSVEGYGSASYKVDRDAVFNAKEVYWGFTAASGSSSATLSVGDFVIPHQVDLKSTTVNQTVDKTDFEILVHKRIQHDTASYGILDLKATAAHLPKEVLVNGVAVPLVNGKLDLSQFKEDALKITLSLTRDQMKSSTLSMGYQSLQDVLEFEWNVELPKLIVPPLPKPEVPEEVPEEVLPDLPVLDLPKPQEPIEIPKAPVEIPNITQPEVDEEPQILVYDYVLKDKTERNSSPSIEGTHNVQGQYYEFVTDLKGHYKGSSTLYVLKKDLGSAIVIPQANEGYEFSHFTQEGLVIDSKDAKLGSRVVAHFKPVTKITEVSKGLNTLKIALPWILLVLLELVLQRDIKRRKERA